MTTRELRGLLVPFITRRVDPQDVDDVVQTVFVRIQRGLADLRDGDKLLAWAYQIARNAIVDHRRHASLRRHHTLDRAHAIAAPLDDDRTAPPELARIIGAFIAMLPPPYRDALQMTELDGLTQAAAARRAGISLPGMKSRVQRARLQLRELLEACCDIAQDTRGAIIEVEPRNPPASIPSCCSPAHPSPEPSVSWAMTNQPHPTPPTANPEPTTEAPCCGGPAPAASGACCVADAAAKAAGAEGCGCAARPAPARSRCC